MTFLRKPFSIRALGCILTVLSLLSLSFLSACNMSSMNPRGGPKADSTERLLQAEGSWAMVEENPGSDPALLHNAARNRVNPADMQRKQFLPDQDLKMAMNEKAAGGQDVNYRLIRVERDVQSLRDDFKKLLPPLSSLIVADKNLDKTIAEIEAKNAIQPASGQPAAMMPASSAAEARQAGAQPRAVPDSVSVRNAAHKATGAPIPMASAAIPTPAPVSASSPVSAPASVAATTAISTAPSTVPSGAATVSNIRLGEHPGKTRLVLDLSGPSSYSTELDNTEKLLLVQIPKAGWSAGQGRSLSQNPLVASYTAQPGPGGGTTLAIELKKPVKIAADSSLPPNSTYQNHRIFLDLVAL